MAFLTESFTALASALATTQAPGRSFQSPSTNGGRVRTSTFAFNTGAGLTVNAKVALAVLPKGAKILSVRYGNEAMGTGATMDLGTHTREGVALSATLLAATAAVATAGTNVVYPPFSTDAGVDIAPLPEQETVLTAVVKGANWAADRDLKGYVLWVENT